MTYVLSIVAVGQNRLEAQETMQSSNYKFYLTFWSQNQ